MSAKMEDALSIVRIERLRQLELKAEGRFRYTPSDHGVTETEILTMINEETGEVARNILSRANLVRDGDSDDTALIKELSQVAALSVAWIERLL